MTRERETKSIVTENLSAEDLRRVNELEGKISNVVYARLAQIKRPFGVLLSGGFDSGYLAAVSQPDVVFSVRFPYGAKYDESRYADAIIDHLHLRDRTRIITPTKEDFERYLEPAVLAMGQPISHFSLVPFYMVMAEARGMTILSGEGPDEYLGGYARQIIFDELRKIYDIPELMCYGEMIDRAIGGNLLVKYAKLMGYDVSEDVLFKMMHHYPLQGAIGKLDMQMSGIEFMEQRLAKATGVNLVYPYIDDELAEYCYHLPDDMKIRNGVTKWAFRHICKKYLPASVLDRAKMGGPVAPVNLWMGDTTLGEFDKTAYRDAQEKILAHERTRQHV